MTTRHFSQTSLFGFLPCTPCPYFWRPKKKKKKGEEEYGLTYPTKCLSIAIIASISCFWVFFFFSSDVPILWQLTPKEFTQMKLNQRGQRCKLNNLRWLYGHTRSIYIHNLMLETRFYHSVNAHFCFPNYELIRNLWKELFKFCRSRILYCIQSLVIPVVCSEYCGKPLWNMSY